MKLAAGIATFLVFCTRSSLASSAPERRYNVCLNRDRLQTQKKIFGDYNSLTLRSEIKSFIDSRINDFTDKIVHKNPNMLLKKLIEKSERTFKGENPLVNDLINFLKMIVAKMECNLERKVRINMVNYERFRTYQIFQNPAYLISFDRKLKSIKELISANVRPNFRNLNRVLESLKSLKSFFSNLRKQNQSILERNASENKLREFVESFIAFNSAMDRLLSQLEAQNFFKTIGPQLAFEFLNLHNMCSHELDVVKILIFGCKNQEYYLAPKGRLINKTAELIASYAISYDDFIEHQKMSTSARNAEKSFSLDHTKLEAPENTQKLVSKDQPQDPTLMISDNDEGFEESKPSEDSDLVVISNAELIDTSETSDFVSESSDIIKITHPLKFKESKSFKDFTDVIQVEPKIKPNPRKSDDSSRLYDSTLSSKSLESPVDKPEVSNSRLDSTPLEFFADKSIKPLNIIKSSEKNSSILSSKTPNHSFDGSNPANSEKIEASILQNVVKVTKRFMGSLVNLFRI